MQHGCPGKPCRRYRRGGFQTRLYHRRTTEFAKLTDMCSFAVGSSVGMHPQSAISRKRTARCVRLTFDRRGSWRFLEWFDIFRVFRELLLRIAAGRCVTRGCWFNSPRILGSNNPTVRVHDTVIKPTYLPIPKDVASLTMDASLTGCWFGETAFSTERCIPTGC